MEECICVECGGVCVWSVEECICVECGGVYMCGVWRSVYVWSVVECRVECGGVYVCGVYV